MLSYYREDYKKTLFTNAVVCFTNSFVFFHFIVYAAGLPASTLGSPGSFLGLPRRVPLAYQNDFLWSFKELLKLLHLGLVRITASLDSSSIV